MQKSPERRKSEPPRRLRSLCARERKGRTGLPALLIEAPALSRATERAESELVDAGGRGGGALRLRPPLPRARAEVVRVKQPCAQRIPASQLVGSISGQAASEQLSSKTQGSDLAVSMDLAPFKLDIDELLADYAKENYTSFADFKRVWMAKKFSYIYEGRPKTNSGVFMQSLFLHCIGHMTSQLSLPQRLAGLYCLYCLYECQPYKPRFKIYLSLEECKQLKDFVVMAKQNGAPIVPVLVKRMLDRGMFLFGFINLLGDNGEKQVEELTAAQNKRIKFASDKLFANTLVQSYMHMDLGAEFELDSIKKLSKEYAEAKELALGEASQIIDVEDARHILQNDNLLGDRVDEVVKKWDAQKEEFYEKTGLSRGNELAVLDNDESGVLPHEDESGILHHEDDGFDEITQLLLE